MSTGYTQFQNGGDTEKPYYPPTGPQLVQGYAPPINTTYPDGGMMAPPPQTIISTTSCMPNDYFGLALFVTICCCLPLGIVGLIKANDVRNRFQMGDFAGAEEASHEAKRYSFLGLGIGIGILAVAIIGSVVYVVVVYAAVSNGG